MTNTKITDQWDAVTRNWFYDKAPDAIYQKSNTVLKLMMDNGTPIFHGGPDSVYPKVTAKLNANYYTDMYDGTIQTQATPSDTDLFDSAHQEGWGYWAQTASLSHKSMVINAGAQAADERVINMLFAKDDALMDSIAWQFDNNILLGDGTNNTILGMTKVFDITNTNYLGFNLTTAAFTPTNVTIATNQNSLTYADLIKVYTDLEDEGKNIDAILAHPDAITRMRVLSEATVDRTQGGAVTVGHTKFDVIGAPIHTSRYMPTTTSTVIYFLNFGNHANLGMASGDDGKRKVGRGDMWLMEFGGPKPLGFETTGWKQWTGYEGVLHKEAWGAFKIACNDTFSQGYISIA